MSKNLDLFKATLSTEYPPDETSLAYGCGYPAARKPLAQRNAARSKKQQGDSEQQACDFHEAISCYSSL